MNVRSLSALADTTRPTSILTRINYGQEFDPRSTTNNISIVLAKVKDEFRDRRSALNASDASESCPLRNQSDEPQTGWASPTAQPVSVDINDDSSVESHQHMDEESRKEYLISANYIESPTKVDVENEFSSAHGSK